MKDSSIGTMASFFESKAGNDAMVVSETPSTVNVDSKREMVDRFYRKLEEMGFNLEELREILECNDSMLILSGAGAGKTTALVFKIIRDLLAGELLRTRVINGIEITTPANILVSTFLKTGAEELRQNFIDWCNKLNIQGVDLNYIQFRTIHSEVYSALKAMGVPIRIIDNTDSMIRQVMQTYGVHSVMSNGKTITKDEVADINCLISYVRNRLDNQRYNHPLMDEYTVDTMQLDLMLNTFKQLKTINGVMDFEDMQEMLLEGLQQNPKVVEFIQNRYDYIFVDEFQDTSQLQYEILKYYFNGAKKVVCLGDDDQCLVEGTHVITPQGEMNIEDIKIGDKVLSGIGQGNVTFSEVNNISKKQINEEIVVIKTKSGHEIKGTKDHIGFVRIVSKEYPHFVEQLGENNKIILDFSMFSSIHKNKNNIYKSELCAITTNEKYAEILGRYLPVSIDINTHNGNHYYSARKISNSIDLQLDIIKKIEKECKVHGIHLDIVRNVRFNDKKYFHIPLSDFVEGMVVPVLEDNKVIEDEVISVTKEIYEGYVYDISLPMSRNFVANNILVHNCIYSWRGSDIDIINEKFKADYKATIKQLTTNYRCSQNILKAVIPSIEKNSLRSPKNLRAYRPGGEVNIVVDGNVNHLMQEVRNDLLRGESVGILARTNADLLIPAILLELSNEDIDYGLSKSVSLDMRIPKQVFGVMDLLTKRYTPEFENLLGMFTTKYRSYEVEKLCNVLNINKDKSLFNLPLEDIEYSAPSLLSMLITLRNQYQIDPKRAYLSLLNIMATDVYNGKSIYAQNAREFVYYIRKIIKEHDLVKDMNINELDRLFNQVLPAKLERRKNITSRRLFIKLSTVHEAKGKEWDNVYIWNNIDGCFPNSVGNRELTKSEFEEERRIHYIAWTRPKKKLIVYTRSDRQGGFLNECDLSGVKFEEVNGISSKLVGLSNTEITVFEKKPNEVDEKKEECFEGIFEDYYQTYTSFSNMNTQEWMYLDMCLTKLGGKDKVIAKLKSMGVDQYPKELIKSAITDTLSSIALNS